MPDQPASDASPARPRLLLLDGHSLAYRAFFALPVENFSTTTGQHDQRGLRVHVDAHQRAARRAADPRRGRLRRLPPDLPHARSTPSTRPTAPSRPTSSRGQVALIKEVLDALRHPDRRDGRLRGRRRHRARSPPRPCAEGFEVLICTGDRDAFQLVSDDVTVLYPRKGVSELARMTPAAVEEKYGVTPRALPRPRGARRGDQRQPARRPGRRAQDRGQVDHDQYDGLDEPRAPTPTRSRARPATSLREHLGRRACATVSSTPWSATSTCRSTPDDLAVQPWDREEVHTVFDSLEFRVLRDRLFATLARPRRRSTTAASSSTATRARGRARSAGWLAEHAPGPDRRRAARRRAPGGPAPATCSRSPWPAADGAAAWLDVDRISPDDDAALADLARRRRRGPRCCTTPRARCWRWPARGWPLAGLASDTALSAYLARPDQRSYDLADLTLRYLKRELKAERARRRRAS